MKRCDWMTDRGFATGLETERREATAQARRGYRIRRSVSRLLTPVGDLAFWVFDRVDPTKLVLLLAGLLSTAISVALRPWVEVPSAALVIVGVMTTMLTVFTHWSLR